MKRGGSPGGPTSELFESGPEDLGADDLFGEAGDAPGVVFVLAAGGLRRLDRADDGFLGYPRGAIFWRDVLELVHEEDLLRARAMISEAIERPGVSLSANLRFLDAGGDWRLMETTVQNVLEAPGDVGLVVASVSDAAPRAYVGPLP